MIAFKRLSIMERIRRLSPSYRRQQDAKLREAIKYLVSHPEAPCMVEGNLIENGYGGRTLADDIFGTRLL